MTDQISRNAAGIDQRIYAAVQYLCAQDEDHATEKNGRGWNGTDGRWAHAIAEKPFETWSHKMGQIAYTMLRKYAGQLALAGIDYAAIEDPTTVPPQPRTPKQQDATITLEDGTLIYRSPRDHNTTQIVREMPHRRWTGRDGTPAFVWRLALDRRNLEGLRTLYARGVRFSPEAVAALKALSSPRTAPPQNQAPEPNAPAHAPQAPSGEPTGYVRVAYLVDADSNAVTYKLKLLPDGVIMHSHAYKTAREAQAAADAINARARIGQVELS